MAWIRRKTELGTVQYICPHCSDYHEYREDFGERTFNENFIFCRRCGVRNGTGVAPANPTSEPLTLEQLREMDGDKINIHYIGDCAGFYEDETATYYGDLEQYIQRDNGLLRACNLPLKYYGKKWTATLYHCRETGECR